MKLNNPFPGTILSKYPTGNIYQFFGENPELYAAAVPGLHGHNGIDVIPSDGKAGHPLVAAANGKIVAIKDTPTGYGKHIRIVTDPDEVGKQYELVYGHCESISVTLNQRILRGDEIGSVGNTGFVISGNTPYWGNAPAGKGVHLHFGIRPLSPKGATWNTQYPGGDCYIIDNYPGLYLGSIDPMPFLVDKQALIISIMQRLVELYKQYIAAKLKGR